MMSEPFPGIVIDPDTRTYEVLGVRMVTGHLMRSPYSPEHLPDRSIMSVALVAALEQHVSPGYFTRMRPQAPEAIHATLLCGENGWWVEVSVYPGGHGYTRELNFGPAHDWLPEPRTADELLMLWRETCARRDAPPDWPNEMYEPGPFAGLEPGTWLWDDDE